jgi:hypothetical protein
MVGRKERGNVLAKMIETSFEVDRKVEHESVDSRSRIKGAFRAAEIYDVIYKSETFVGSLRH